jgi:hypothetical protein
MTVVEPARDMSKQHQRVWTLGASYRAGPAHVVHLGLQGPFT